MGLAALANNSSLLLYLFFLILFPYYPFPSSPYLQWPLAVLSTGCIATNDLGATTPAVNDNYTTSINTYNILGTVKEVGVQGNGEGLWFDGSLGLNEITPSDILAVRTD